MKSVFISSIIAVTLFATANTYAATTNGGVIHFEGELVNAACAVNTESADQVV
ncbi:TPA: type 1 fimbrial protein subunit FimA, partial [Escherichia albertii]|nr:type 1 fimbrial protein subunit FimA [Escherichia albertii]